MTLVAGRGPGVSEEDPGTLVAIECPDLYRYAMCITGDRTEAQDVVGDAVLQAANAGVPLTCSQSRQDVSDDLDHKLTTERCGAFEAHLAGCASCPERYQALVRAIGPVGVRRDPESATPHERNARVRDRTLRR